jgi:hypothetical protein
MRIPIGIPLQHLITIRPRHSFPLSGLTSIVHIFRITLGGDGVTIWHTKSLHLHVQ